MGSQELWALGTQSSVLWLWSVAILICRVSCQEQRTRDEEFTSIMIPVYLVVGTLQSLLIGVHLSLVKAIPHHLHHRLGMDIISR
ncbi:uncharacterized protein BDW43DRAFT_292407 [Aspergillus alliaceus]|uniref:uncharacterized protein n=1 Tax=Petromyces alliaceus TaxID=209559 RepID=UPI0012A5EF22|nr:uncharacterized protein BDW43DRAFT_292407 [Aspergillus alliaceus]KAB8228042.1 hypothetical protein BDW43DRAFT_292407 [Aspergillus alliaceus]